MTVSERKAASRASNPSSHRPDPSTRTRPPRTTAGTNSWPKSSPRRPRPQLQQQLERRQGLPPQRPQLPPPPQQAQPKQAQQALLPRPQPKLPRPRKSDKPKKPCARWTTPASTATWRANGAARFGTNNSKNSKARSAPRNWSSSKLSTACSRSSRKSSRRRASSSRAP